MSSRFSIPLNYVNGCSGGRVWRNRDNPELSLLPREALTGFTRFGGWTPTEGSLMGQWTETELARIGAGDELRITSPRADGTFRPYVPIWVVRVGDDIFVRSYRGTDS